MDVEIVAMAIAALVPELRSLIRWYLRVRRRRAGRGDGATHSGPPLGEP